MGIEAASPWSGLETALPLLRRRLNNCRITKEYGRLPVTWMVRSDRQILEVYQDAAYCFRLFERFWQGEMNEGCEIGWHPHVVRWDASKEKWQSFSAHDEDLNVLSECLATLRRHVDIRSVRTGWNYHSNALMNFFDCSKLVADGSAVPGCVNSRTEGSYYNWVGTPRTPYHPSQADFRRPAEPGETSLKILELPVMVRKLNFPLHAGRYLLRTGRALRRGHADLAEWQAAGWQGVLLTLGEGTFLDAAQQTLNEFGAGKMAVLATYFHSSDMTSPPTLETLIRNLDSLADLAERRGYTIVPCTLSSLASKLLNV